MTTIYSIYDQVAELLATLEPNKILAMKASPELQKRLDELVQKSNNQEFTKQEKDELDHCLVLERLIRLAKTSSLHT